MSQRGRAYSMKSPKVQKVHSRKAGKQVARRQNRALQQNTEQAATRQLLPTDFLEALDTLRASRRVSEGPELGDSALSVSDPMRRDAESREMVGARLRSLRKASGLSQAAWCRLVEITAPGWHHYESGTNRISLNQAIKVADKAGVSLDWIYRGKAELQGSRTRGFRDYLPAHQQIAAAEETEAKRKAILDRLRAVPSEHELAALAREAADELAHAWAFATLAAVEIGRLIRLVEAQGDESRLGEGPTNL